MKTTLNEQNGVSPGGGKLTAELRQDVRESLKLCVRFVQDEKIDGYTEDVGLGGLRVVCSRSFRPGTPLALQCAFGDVCYLNISGQVIYSFSIGDGVFRKQVVGMKFSGLREWDRKILSSALQELKRNVSIQEKSLLTILVSNDSLAQEASELSDVILDESLAFNNKGVKKSKKFTSHPAWIFELNEQIEPNWKAVLGCSLVQKASVGTLSLKQMRAWITQLYPFIETFPKWIALNIAKSQDRLSRGFLIENVRVEKKHAEQWAYMAEGFGIDPTELDSVRPLPEVEALTHWLWSVNTRGTLAEAVGATNYAIEGVTQGIAKLTLKGLPQYEGMEGVHLDKKAYWWMEAHSKYDDLHPVQALEIMKLYATTKDLQEKVKFATQRSLEYLLLALETCYSRFQPQESAVMNR